MITATLVFTLLLHLHPERYPRPVQKALMYLSGISLGIFLLSWVSDQIVYNGYLNPLVFEVNMRWKYYFAAVPSSFLLSVLGASVLRFIQIACGKIYRIVREHLTKQCE